MKILITETQLSLIKSKVNEQTDDGTIYSDYEFDNMSIPKDSSNIFFSGTRRTSDDAFKYRVCDDNEDCFNYIHITDGVNDFKFPQWDKNRKPIVKLSSRNDLYISVKDFKKFYPDFSFDKKSLSLSDIAGEIKKRYKFLSLMNTILPEVYVGLKTEDGKPMFGKGQDNNCETNVGVINYRGVKYGYNNALISNWSILNYFNTNSLVIQFLLKLYFKETGASLNDFANDFGRGESGFLRWVRDNKETLFSPSSMYLDEMEKLNLSTLKRGIAREQQAVKIAMEIHRVGEGSITEYCPGSIEDTKNGRDFKVSLDTETFYYYQSKPLNGEMVEEKDEKNKKVKYVIYTHSMKQYGNTVNRLIFLNEKGKYYIFENKNYEVLSYGGVVKFSNPPLYQS
jgi:hypothetical protein